MKIYSEKHGYVTHERCDYNGMRTVTLHNKIGSAIDEIRCDTAIQARDYVKSFRRIARV